MKFEEETEVLYRALNSPIGIVVVFSGGDINQARQRLYMAKKALADPDLTQLQFRASPHSKNEIYIVKPNTKARGDIEVSLEEVEIPGGRND